jgi:hypothetical protein
VTVEPLHIFRGVQQWYRSWEVIHFCMSVNMFCIQNSPIKIKVTFHTTYVLSGEFISSVYSSVNGLWRSTFDPFFFVVLRPSTGHGLLIIEVSRSHTTTQDSRQDSSGRVISSSQRRLPAQHTTLTTGKHLCTRRDSKPNLSRRATADLRLRPRGHWDRQYLTLE